MNPLAGRPAAASRNTEHKGESMEQENRTPAEPGDLPKFTMEVENRAPDFPDAPSIPSPQKVISPQKVEALKEKWKDEQNPLMAILTGFLAAVLGAAVWAAVTVATGYQIGWMAVGVGFLVGWSVKKFGRGVSPVFGIIGGGLALLGTLLGNFFTVAAILSRQESIGILSVLGLMILNPGLTFDILKEAFSVMDLVFYAFAVYYGYRYSFRTVTKEETAELYA
jgi:hypothetical protein